MRRMASGRAVLALTGHQALECSPFDRKHWADEDE